MARVGSVVRAKEGSGAAFAGAVAAFGVVTAARGAAALWSGFGATVFRGAAVAIGVCSDPDQVGFNSLGNCRLIF